MTQRTGSRIRDESTSMPSVALSLKAGMGSPMERAEELSLMRTIEKIQKKQKIQRSIIAEKDRACEAESPLVVHDRQCPQILL